MLNIEPSAVSDGLMEKHFIDMIVWLQIDMQDLPDGKHKKMEKYILRKAFDDPLDPYLPESVLWRQKEQFSDGVGYSWVDGLKEYAQQVRSGSIF